MPKSIKVYDDEIVKEALSLYKSGLTIDFIATKLEIGKATL